MKPTTLLKTNLFKKVLESACGLDVSFGEKIF